MARATTWWPWLRQCRREWKESLPPEMRATTLREDDDVEEGMIAVELS